jgi:hypothetical protein
MQKNVSAEDGSKKKVIEFKTVNTLVLIIYLFNI